MNKKAYNGNFTTLFVAGIVYLALAASLIMLFSHFEKTFASEKKLIHGNEENRKFLVIVLDGLRPDYITPELMPNLYSLGQDGVIAKNHHVTFPSVTRVNSPSIGTGAYPGTHGLMHNTIYMPDISDESMSTGSANNLMKMEQILTVPSLGEHLEKHGKTIFVGSSGSTGTSLLMNPNETGAGVWNARGLVLPDEMKEYAKEVVGDFPPRTSPNYEQNRWAVDAYLKVGIDKYNADVSLIWLNDPDGTAHKNGIGADETNTALEHVDQELGRILEGLEERNLLKETNIIITADHGFSTHSGGLNISNIMEEYDLQGDARVIANTQIFVEDQDHEKLKMVVRALQKSSSVGAIFTRPKHEDSSEGIIKGTLSMDLVSYNHSRAADILVSASWDHEKNEYGYMGSSAQSGIAGHGTTSPYDLQINLFASGPDFRNKTISKVPSGNIDIAPTILYLLELPPEQPMDGRALEEITIYGSKPDSVEFHIDRYETSPLNWNPDYRMILEKARVGGTEYLRKAWIAR